VKASPAQFLLRTVRNRCRSQGGVAEKNTMGWKLTFALVLVSVAVVSALAAGGEPENEAVVREEAAKQLSALREYLLRR
jgi:hypothetical protein